jgi:hypothetical protein
MAMADDGPVFSGMWFWSSWVSGVWAFMVGGVFVMPACFINQVVTSSLLYTMFLLYGLHAE